MYVLGVPATIIIDDSIPLDDKGFWLFANGSKDGALWGPLLEKVFAKISGSYENIVGGDPIVSIEALSGAHSQQYRHKGHPSNADISDSIEQYTAE